MKPCSLFLLVPLLAVAILASGAEPTDAIYQVGVAKIDITPDYPIRLNGFGFRREESEGVAQRIWAKALAISQGEEPPVVLLAIDSLGVRLPMVEQLAQRLHETAAIPRENVALTFSHSHCTPKVQGACDNIFSAAIPPAHQEHIDRYTRELTDRLVEAAQAAIRERQPATLEWNVGEVRFAKNRRRAGGPVDHDLPLLVVKNLQGTPRAIYVNYACHCVTLSFNRISGDWSGHAQEELERRFPGAVALVSIGCGSDSNPTSGVTGDKIDIAAQQGAEIAAEVQRLMQQPGRPLRGSISAKLQLIELPLNPLPTRAQWAELAKTEGPAAYNAQTQLARLERGESLPTVIPYPVQSFTFGDRLQMVFLAGEVCVDYSLRFKRELDRDRLWINAYSNDFCSYIPSERLAREGGYGGGGEIPYFALPATLAAGLEQKIVDEVRRQTPPDFYARSETQGIPAKSPAESMQCLQTHDDLRVELVAAEPLVADPVAIDFGPDGKLWVVEMMDYARGVNDEFTPEGRVRFLTDTNGDGQYDTATEFLRGLRFPTEVKVWRDGVLICDAPNILFAADTDQDGKADVQEVVFRGFATHNPHARVNSLRFGLDNWLYGSGGLFGGKITSADGQTVDVSNRDFRIEPHTLRMEPVTGQTQQGRPRDDWDNWFGCTNGTLLTHYVVSDHYARRNPHAAPPKSSVYVPDYPDSERLFPRGDLVLFKLSGAPGRPTSACGAEIYRDDWLGADYAGNAFVCEPVNQLVHRLVLTRKGVTFGGRRAPQESDREFLASTDRWFRPVQVRTGPDGALWIVDMYRYVIEHPQWIPPETLTGLNVYAGQGMGRIYRIVPKDRGTRPVTRLDPNDPAKLAAALDSPNGVQRDLAQQLLVVARRTEAEPALAELLANSTRPVVRVQVASTLAGLNRLQPAQLLPLLDDPHPEVRRHAIRLSEPFLQDSAELQMAVLRLVDDPAAEVRLQLAYSLGGCRQERAAAALATLALHPAADPFVLHAVMSSLRPDNVVPVLRAALTADAAPRNLRTVEALLAAAAAMGDASTVNSVISQIVQPTESFPPEWRWTTLARVLDAADRRQLERNRDNSEWLPAVRKTYAAARAALLDPQGGESRQLAAIQLLGRPAGPATRSWLTESGRVTPSDPQPAQPKAPSTEKHSGSASPDAATDPAATEIEQLASLLNSRYSPAVQAAAVRGLARLAGAAAPQHLLRRWPDATPALRQQILDTLLGRDEWLPPLLAAIKAGTVLPGELDATRRQRLLTHRLPAVRDEAATLLAAVTSSRREVIAAWQPALSLSGDHERGREVYRKRCSACHQLDGVGFQVGPDLAALTNKSPNALLVAILDPNRDVDGRYVAYVAALADGRTVSGMLVSEAGNSVTLREQGGKEHVLLRNELDEFRTTGKSVMPEGLEKDLTPQELADIIAFLLPPRVPPKAFAGNRPELIKPDARGAIALPATAAEIYGQDIVFESTSPFQNIGYWHDPGDYAGWQLDLPAASRFDVYLDYSCADESAGNAFRLDGAEPTVRGIVAGTGDWSQYRVVQIGTVELPAGRSTLTLHFDGAKRRPALLDLRGIHLVPAGILLAGRAGEPAAGTDQTPVDPAAIARVLLDDSLPAAEREQPIAAHPELAGPILAALVADLPRDSREEYRRIPWIWRVAIAAGKRNEEATLREVLDVSLPQGATLTDWSAVVIGGGIINGLTQAGQWPKPRIEQVLKVDGVLVARWQKAVDLAAAMADDEQVPTGTRYDALRMVAMGPWDLRGDQLRRYLAKGVHAELQMGAVSGVADVQHPAAGPALLSAMAHYSERNRELALDGLVRTPDRALVLLEAIEKGKVSREQLGERRTKLLREHADARVKEQAQRVLQP